MVFARQRGEPRRFALTAMRMAFLEGLDLGEPDAVRVVAPPCGIRSRRVHGRPVTFERASPPWSCRPSAGRRPVEDTEL